MAENIDTEQPTFNGMDRQAMVIGVPLPALVVCGFVGVMAAMISLPILEGSALFFLLLPVPFIMFFRTICANDDQAIRIYVYELKWFLRKRNSKLFGGTNTFLATKFGRQLSDYQRFFEQGSAKTTSSIRFSAQNLPTRYQ